MSSTSVLLVNAIAYSLVAIYMFIRRKVSLGLLIWVIYTISAWTSYFFIQHPMYKMSMHASEQTLLPCIYLFCFLLICIMPLTHIDKVNKIIITESDALKVILIICIIFQLVFIIVDMRTAFFLLNSNIELGDIRTAAYGREVDSYSLVTKNAITNSMFLLYMGMKPLATGLSVVLFFCYKRSRKLIRIFALTTLLYNIQTVIITAGRGELVITFFTYAFSLYLVKNFLSNTAKRIILFITIPFVVISGLFFWAVTVSRFGDSGVFYMYKYLGEPMNNFNGILFNHIHGNTDGQAYFSYFHRYFLQDNTYVNKEGQYALMEKTTGVPAFIFYTFVGGLIIEFGKIVPLFIALFMNRLTMWIKNVRIAYLDRILFYVFFSYFYICGLFTFPIQNFTGFIVFYLIIFHFIFCKKPTPNKEDVIIA